MPSYSTYAKFQQYGLRAGVIAGIPEADITASIGASSSVADGYLRGKFTLPLVAWGEDLELNVCKHAQWEVATAQKGFNPENPANSIYLERYNQAVRWFEQVARGFVTPSGIVDSTPEAYEGGPECETSEPRGW